MDFSFRWSREGRQFSGRSQDLTEGLKEERWPAMQVSEGNHLEDGIQSPQTRNGPFIIENQREMDQVKRVVGEEVWAYMS
jgi:hypothetical protein